LEDKVEAREKHVKDLEKPSRWDKFTAIGKGGIKGVKEAENNKIGNLTQEVTAEQQKLDNLAEKVLGPKVETTQKVDMPKQTPQALNNTQNTTQGVELNGKPIQVQTQKQNNGQEMETPELVPKVSTRDTWKAKPQKQTTQGEGLHHTRDDYKPKKVSTEGQTVKHGHGM